MPANPARDTLTRLDYRVIMVPSLLLLPWLIAMDPALNRRAILYSRSADAYLRGGRGARSANQRPERTALFASGHCGKVSIVQSPQRVDSQ